MDYKAFFAALAPDMGEIALLQDEPMSRHTTFRIGGPADVFLRPHTVAALSHAVSAAKQTGVPYVVVGNGSNLLVQDKGYSGVVICTGELRKVRADGDMVYAQAGALLGTVARVALEASLSGTEFAAGIPGTLGGAVYMNAGAYGGEMKDVLSTVEYIDGSGALQTRPVSELALRYRTSIFKDRVDWTVTGATLCLKKEDAALIRARMEDYAARRRGKQPLDLPSAGSTFKRPEGYFAGKLIEDAGLRGFSVGGAQVSEKHAGFVVNAGGATCADVCALIETVKARVKQQFGVSLECEVRLL